jgi:hypothetical protein
VATALVEDKKVVTVCEVRGKRGTDKKDIEPPRRWAIKRAKDAKKR